MKLASIEKIKSVRNHPNADLLDIVKVFNYEAIVKRGQYKEGDFVIFIQPDTVLPEKPWAEFYKAKSNRVKAIRLRNSWSMGIVENVSLLYTECDDGSEDLSTLEGYEVSNILGITKYEPPAPKDLSAKGNLPFGINKTDEERWQSIEVIPYGELVDVTLKIDGSSCTAFYKNGDVGVTSRSLELKLECENGYTTTIKKLGILNRLSDFCKKNNVNLALRGEIYGQGFQSGSHNPHSKKPVDFALFSVLNLDTLQYERKGSPFYFYNVAKELYINTVDLLEENVILTPELIKKYDEELTEIKGVPFEGVVINGKDFSFKIINKSYDSKK